MGIVVSQCECWVHTEYVDELESSPGAVTFDLGSHSRQVLEVDDVAKRPVDMGEVSPGNSKTPRWLAEPADVRGPKYGVYRHGHIQYHPCKKQST